MSLAVLGNKILLKRVKFEEHNMSWRWRKSFNRGPLRTTFSKKGVGHSIGIPGLRFGRSSTGKLYMSFGIPGTGLYWQKYFGSKKNSKQKKAKNENQQGSK